MFKATNNIESGKGKSPLPAKPKLKGQVKFVNKDKNLFFVTLKKRVDLYFTEHSLSKFGNTAMVIKTFVLLSVYILPFVCILVFNPPFIVSLVLWVLMGLGVAGLGMSVMHDANHGAYSTNKGVNYLMGHVLNLLGGSAVNWKYQHNILHHTYPNIIHMDEDIDDKLILRFTPHTEVKPVHRFQWIYCFLFYGLTSLYWVTGKDFVQFVKFKQNGVNSSSKKENRVMLARIIAIKVVYMFVFLVLPSVFFAIPFGEVIAGFLIMHFVSGLVLTVIFQLAHSLEGTEHPIPNEQGIIENDWAIHQMKTTMNFSRNNKLLSWYIGGLNFQVEHHLFPRISHMHYPRLSAIVKETAAEFNVPYLEHTTFAQALQSHITYLKKLGKLPDLNELG
ncbi:linoleoyl-CoA desaturase [Filimonas lacunae]|uniref:Linoleoyl-CoA desaturase n=1 Tax=Filimonas lacunae TaxID=477680 RepID=A0A173MEW1_9BACT|nr:acyl-CoA desaturase [Filimonas lacunae]BAV06019.1 linoleoyl-CoA desaturase [Filimonas lacunae]SIT24229.1 linoleoyl-CoA desaturase [Filimonas lacunae]